MPTSPASSSFVPQVPARHLGLRGLTLTVMGVDAVGAGFRRPGVDGAARLLAVARRLAPAAELMVLPGEHRMQLVMVAPDGVDTEAFWTEVLFATVPALGPDVGPQDLAALGVTWEVDAAAARRIFHVGATGREPGNDSTLLVARDAARQVGTFGPVLTKTVQMAHGLARHLAATIDAHDSAQDVAGEVGPLIDDCVLAWSRWHRVVPDTVGTAQRFRLSAEGHRFQVGSRPAAIALSHA